MQSKTSRVALLVVAVAIAVAAFLVLRPGGEDEERATAPAGQSEADGAAERGGGAETASGERGESGSRPEAAVPEVEIRNGDVVGGVQEIEVKSGERIEFEVSSDAPDEIHVHGYEVTEEVEPGKPTRFSFSADAEGIYEVETHDIGQVVIAELRVAPP